MKRGAVLGKEPRVDRKVFTTAGFPDFASGVSIVFSGYFPAAVSDSETVFLCPLGSSTTTLQFTHSTDATPALHPAPHPSAPARLVVPSPVRGRSKSTFTRPF